MDGKNHVKLFVAVGTVVLSMAIFLSGCGCSSSGGRDSYSQRAQELGVSTADYVNAVNYWSKALR